MDTSEFARILDDTVILSDAPFQEQVSQNEKLYGYAQNIMPEKLFRDSKCNERSIDAFYRDKVGVSSSISMNDGFDARLYFDKNVIRSWRDMLVSEATINGIREFFKSGNNLPEEIAVFPGMIHCFEAIVALAPEQFEQFIAFYTNFVSSDIERVIDSIADLTQKTLKFCCLSETINSSAMWGLYANNESGFALAYDCRDLYSSVPLENGRKRLCTCLPIIYGNSRFQVPAEYIMYMLTYRLMNTTLLMSGYANYNPYAAQAILSSLPCPDNLIPTKIALHKSNEWKHEAEWRLFCSSSDDQDFQNGAHGHFTLKPSALYLGRRISSIYEKILSDIAKEKGLPIYKMSLDDDSISYDLIPEQVE